MSLHDLALHLLPFAVIVSRGLLFPSADDPPYSRWLALDFDGLCLLWIDIPWATTRVRRCKILYEVKWTDDDVRTTHVPHSHLELLPIPSVLPAVHVPENGLQLVQSCARLVTEVTLADLVPVLLRDFALDAAGFNLGQPFVDRRILLRIAEKHRRVLPRFVYGLKVKLLDSKCVKHCGNSGVEER